MRPIAAPVNLAWAALTFAIVGILALRTPEPTARAMVGRTLPDLDLPDLATGRPTPLRAAVGGAPALVSFYASWCGPCAEEAPVMAALTSSGVRVVGVAYRDAPSASAGFLARAGAPYRTALVDGDGQAGAAFAIKGVPETFAVDRDGVIRGERAGALTAADAARLVRAAGR